MAQTQSNKRYFKYIRRKHVIAFLSYIWVILHFSHHGQERIAGALYHAVWM